MIPNSTIKRWSLNIVNNYFILTAINGLLFLLGLVSLAKLELLIVLAGIVLSICYLLERTTFIDVFIIFFLLISSMMSLFSNYGFHLWYEGCRNQLLLTIFFFVGRYSQMANDKIFEKAIMPIVITCLVGLVLYILSPSWYIDYKMQIWSNEYVDNDILLEMTRFSAFWSYPYWVSYGCAILGLYILYIFFIKEKIDKKNIYILIFLLFILVLTQQRAPLFSFIAFILYYILRESFTKRYKGLKKKVKIYIFYLTVSIVGLFFLIINFVDIEMLMKLIEKIEVMSNTSNFISERAGIFSEFQNMKTTLFGDGIGRYSHIASYEGNKSITDQQYMKILYELGYCGCFCYLIIITTVILKGFNNIRINMFELSVIAFYLVAMTGANCLAVSEEHAMIFWLCCGRIYNNDLLKYKKEYIGLCKRKKEL